MKTIGMHELVKGDIFTFELKANGREAFEVLETSKGKTVLCQSRNENYENPQSKRIKGKVYLLRSLNINH